MYPRLDAGGALGLCRNCAFWGDDTGCEVTFGKRKQTVKTDVLDWHSALEGR